MVEGLDDQLQEHIMVPGEAQIRTPFKKKNERVTFVPAEFVSSCHSNRLFQYLLLKKKQQQKFIDCRFKLSTS